LAANNTSLGNTGLSANTLYYYRAYAYNTCGNSPYSNVASATTLSLSSPTPTPTPKPSPTPTPVPSPTPSSSPWQKAFGSTANDAGQAVAFDSSGNLYVAGYFQGTVNLGGNCAPLTSNTSTSPDAFLAKYSSAGSCLWAKGIGGTVEDSAYGVTVDTNDNVIVAGYFTGSADFGRGAVNGQPGYNIFVAKYGPDGSYQWANTYGSPGGGSNIAYGVAVDSSGNVGLTGQFQNSIDFGGGSITANGSFQDIFVVKLSSTGGYLWSKGFGSTSIDIGRGIDFDLNGNVVVVGQFMSTVDFGCGALTSTGGNDIFVVKYSATGSCLWAKKFGDTADQFGMSVAVDFAGNIVLTGPFAGTLNFGGSNLVDTYFSSYDIYVAKLDSSGGHVWSKSFGTINSDQGRAVAVDNSGNVVITGYFLGTIDFGGGPITTSGGLNTFVAKYSAGGSYLWSQGYTGSNQSWGVATDRNGNVGVTGYFQTSMTTDQGLLSGPGGLDAFLVKRAP
jgi:hypothetical protein